MRIGRGAAAAAVLAGMFTSPALAGPCGSGACSTRVAVKGSSVVPTPDEFPARGDIFSDRFTDVALPLNGSRQVNLGFSVNFGFGNVSSLFINENGAVSFQQPLGAVAAGPISARAVVGGFRPVTNLADLGVPVIAPFYADLVQGSGAGDTRLSTGDITVQYGLADPFADGGSYRREDAGAAVRITWYGLSIAGSNTLQDPQAFAQLLISSSRDGTSSFEFRYGLPDNPGQDGYGSIAGFALGKNRLQFSGPYRDGIPTFFEFDKDGRYVGQGAMTAVPEPAMWIELLLGFGVLAAAMRWYNRRRSGRVVTA